MGFIQSVESNSNFPLVLKILGVAMFAIAFLASWSHIPLLYKVVMLAGVAAFFVGLRYKKIYAGPDEIPPQSGTFGSMQK